MPELPEVETIRQYLSKKIKRKIVKQVNILNPKQFVGNSADIIGAKIIQLYRKGKYLQIQLSNNLYLNIHLKMSGQILYADNILQPVFKYFVPRADTNRMPGKTTRVIIEFNDNSAIFFNDVRKFGWMKISSHPEGPLSADVLSKDFTLEYFQKIITSSKKAIKNFLLDQTKLAGLGNIYANDSLFEAGINPLRLTNTLNPHETEKLFYSIKKIIDEAIKYNGSSASDENYILPDTTRGEYQHHFRVYHRENKPCIICGNLVKRVKHHGRSSFYCKNCQK